MIISCIVAVSENWVIGKDNQIPWYLPADLKYFKKRTSGHHIIMGRKCFQSIGRPLPKRTNIIISRNPFFIVSNCFTANSIQESLNIAFENGETEAFIIGGSQIYEQSMDLWDRLYLTKIHTHVEGDVYFPLQDLSDWKIENEVNHLADAKNPHNYSFLDLVRK